MSYPYSISVYAQNKQLYVNITLNEINPTAYNTIKIGNDEIDIGKDNIPKKLGPYPLPTVSTNVVLLGGIINKFQLSSVKTYTPVSNICFLGNTPITTDQGIVAIEDIDPDLYTIDGKPIVAISKTKSKDYLVCFEKDALFCNVPSKRTIMSKNHKVSYLGKMKEAYRFCNLSDKVYKIPYQGQTLYNVLMEKHSTMKVNNLTCETLNPNHEMAIFLRL